MAMDMLVLYLVGGAGMAVFVLVWALKSRQFQDQDRARFLPLRDGLEFPEKRSVPTPVPGRKHTPSLILMIATGVCALLVLVHLFLRVVFSL